MGNVHTHRICRNIYIYIVYIYIYCIYIVYIYCMYIYIHNLYKHLYCINVYIYTQREREKERKCIISIISYLYIYTYHLCWSNINHIYMDHLPTKNAAKLPPGAKLKPHQGQAQRDAWDFPRFPRRIPNCWRVWGNLREFLRIFLGKFLRTQSTFEEFLVVFGSLQVFGRRNYRKNERSPVWKPCPFGSSDVTEGGRSIPKHPRDGWVRDWCKPQ